MFVPPRLRKNYKARRENPNERDFIKLYRFSSDSVQWLAEHFLNEENDDETRGGALNAFVKMKIMLRYIADPGFQIGVGEDIGVSQATVSRTIRAVTQQIINKAEMWIRFPQDNAAMEEAKEQWQEKFNFPTAIGAIDCTLIPIKKVAQHRHGNEYICRKHFAAINVQATCNSKEIFTSVSAEWPGSVHDSRIWRNSQICSVLRRFNNVVLLGDKGYGIEKCLLTPYQAPNTPTEIAYNILFKRERVIIERCFGQLKQRFPILQHPVRVSLEFIPSLITACFVLHNVGKYLGDEAVLEDYVYEENNDEEGDDDEREDENQEPNEVQARAVLRREGQRKRDDIATIIYNNQV